MPREAGGATPDADEAKLWAYLRWARIDRAISKDLDQTLAVDTYNAMAGEPDRVPRYLAWLATAVGDEARVEHVRRRAVKASQTGPSPGPRRRLRVTAD